MKNIPVRLQIPFVPPQIGNPGVTVVSVAMAAERLRIPSFHHNVQDWLSHIEAYLASTSANDQQKFSAVVGALPTEVAILVQTTITSPPSSDRFAALKKALLGVYRQPDHHHLEELQSIVLGDLKPSVLWQQMQLINVRCNTSLPKPVLRSMFLQKLPWEVRVTLSTFEESTPDTTFVSAADHVASQMSTHSQSSTRTPFPVPVSVNQASPSSSCGLQSAREPFPTCMVEAPTSGVCPRASLVTGNTVQDHICAEGAAMAATSDSPYRQILRRLEAIEEQMRVRVPDASAFRQGQTSYNRPSSSGFSNEGLCWYHVTFGANARQCRSPCQWTGNEYRGGR